MSATPPTNELAVAVPGGWVRIETEFLPADGAEPSPTSAAQAAEFVRNLDPQAIREQVANRTTPRAADPFALTLAIVADLLDGGQP